MFAKLRDNSDLRNFYKSFLAIGIPLTIQQLVSSSLNFIDNLMIGRLGTEYLAAVGFAGSLYRILDLVIFGVCSGMGVFVAQYYGKKNYDAIKKIFGLMMRCAVFIGIVFAFIGHYFSNEIIKIFSKDTRVIEIGVSYIEIVVYCYIFYAISSGIAYTLRSMGYTKYPMFAAAIGVVANTFFNYCLIYGNFGLPRLEEKGAAIATIIARIIEMIIILTIVYIKDFNLKGKLSSYINVSKELIKEIIRVSTPVMCTESMWILGTIGLTIAYAKLGTDQAACAQIADVVSTFSAILFMGIANSAAVIIGHTIGEGNKEKVIFYAKQILYVAFIMAAFCFVMVEIFVNPIVSLYHLPEEITHMAEKTVQVYGGLIFFKMVNWAILIGIFRAGGDTKVAFYLDILPLWLYGVPMAFVGAYFALPIYYVIAIAEFCEVIKLCFAMLRYRSLRWMKDVTV